MITLCTASEVIRKNPAFATLDGWQASGWKWVGNLQRFTQLSQKQQQARGTNPRASLVNSDNQEIISFVPVHDICSYSGCHTQWWNCGCISLTKTPRIGICNTKYTFSSRTASTTGRRFVAWSAVLLFLGSGPCTAMVRVPVLGSGPAHGN